MKTVREHNEEKRVESSKILLRHGAGLACNDCGHEVEYVNPNIILTSMPPKQEVICSGCGKRDYIVC